LLVLIDGERDRGRPTPDRVVRLGIRDKFVKVPLDEARIDTRLIEFGMGHRVKKKAGICPN
jgi:hypothetical protein